MNLIAKVKCSVQNLLLILLTSMLVSACGSSSDLEPSRSATEGNGVTLGTVFGEQGPLANAAVIVKSRDGHLLGSAVTNAQGQYKVASPQSGLFMAEAKESTGKVWYSISQNGNMNVTHLGDLMIRLWYQAKGLDVSKVFAVLDASTPMPVMQELTVAANQILTVPANALGKGSVDLFGNEMTPTLSKILQGTRIESGGAIRINVPEIKFTGVYKIKTRLSKQGDVVYEGSEETESANVPLTKGSIDAIVGSSGSAKRQLKSSSAGSNEYWMKDNWEFIKDKKFGELVIPGTHDSGTYKLSWGTGGDTAKTQTNSIGDQLKDGIRYFDLRVREASHRGCADYSVWWIYHTWDSYRLQVALDEIKAFLSKPGNEKEVIVLDFQDTKIIYDDGRARDVLLDLIQNRLGAYLAKNEGGWTWQEATMSDLVANNKRVIVLLENFLYTNISKPDFKPGCGVAKIDYRNFSNRTSEMVSAYDEDYAKTYHQIKYLIASELDQAYMNSDLWLRQKANYQDRYNIYIREVVKAGMAKELYDLTYPDSALLASKPDSPSDFERKMDKRVVNYKEFQKTNKLRVMQLVSRPSNSWYAAATAAPFGGDDLLTYATREINTPLNFMESGCQEGWMGKRLRMGVEGDSTKWNAPNIIIADNYKSSEWVLPNYRNGKWVKDQNATFVDMAISLNKIKRDPSRLQNATNFEDGICLQ